jgi:small subunit ribosomal protein S21
MTRQEKRKGESVDSLLRKFKRKIKNEGTLKELREREYFEKPSESRKKQLKAAVSRTRTEQRENELT